MASNQNPGPQTIRVPFLDATDIRPGQEALITKDQIFLNGFFEPVKNPLGKAEYYFIKRPGTTLFQSVTAGVGRGCYAWKTTGKLYSVKDGKILSGSTDLGVSLTTNSGFVNFEETRPGATTQYLGINDGHVLYLVGTDDSVVVLNNVTITGVSVANPTHITAPVHGLNTGNKIIIRNCTTVTPSTINDVIYTITKLDADHFTIPLNVTASGAGPFGTIGVFPSPNTADLKYMDGYFFTMKNDGTIWNCSVDDPTNWPSTSFISSIMVPGRSVGLGRANNLLVAFSDRHYQMFYDAANPFGSPLANVEQAEQKVGCVSTNTIAFQENILFWVSNSLTGGFSVYRLDGTSNLQDIGNFTLNRSLTSNFFLTPGSPQAKKVILTSGTSWTVPTDFNKFNNTIEAIGPGGNGGAGSGFSGGGGGGGGGAYTKLNNFDPGGAGSIAYVIGSPGTDTTFNVSTVIAKHGNNGVSAAGGGAGGAGGLASACTPATTAHSGGTGGSAGPVGGPGGGAAGINAGGQNGDSPNNTGGQGDPPNGGLGGMFNQAGQAGAEWVTAGSGGGGAGGFSTLQTGGNGGNYGGGGGGAFGTASTSTGANGVIVITYTPVGVSDQDAANGYILRLAGHMFYVLNLVNNKETWVYQIQTGIWVLWRSGVNSDAPFPVVNATSFSPPGQPSLIVGQDIGTGTLWQLDSTSGQDNGINYEFRIQTNPLTFGTMQRKFYDRVELVAARPNSSTPILISYSDDNYITFSSPRSLDIGDVRAFSRAWNNSRRRAWRVSYTGPNTLRMHAIEFEIESGKE